MTEPIIRRRELPSLGWAALGVLSFSLTFPATTLAERSFDPMVVGAGRSVISAAIVAALLWRLRAPVPDRIHWPGLVAVALGCGIGFGVLTALALHHASSSHAAVVVGLLPAATAIVAVIRTGDRPGWRFWAASAVGTCAVTAYSLSRRGGTLHTADLLLLAAVVVAAVGYAEGGRLTRTVPGWQVTAWGLLLALPISFPLTAVSLSHHTPEHLTAPAVIGFLYVGTVSTFFGFIAWYRGLAEAGVARASQLQLTQPLLTIIWSAPLLGERLDASGVLTAITVAVCVLITQRSRIATGARSRPAARWRGAPRGPARPCPVHEPDDPPSRTTHPTWEP